MHIVNYPSRYFDPNQIAHPENTGAVDWSSFNAHFHKLLSTPWYRVNTSTAYSWPRRLGRLLFTPVLSGAGAMRDLEGKARIFSTLPIPAHPTIVYFGAEAGWEAFLLQALFGNGGRVVLIDNDPAAYERFQSSPMTFTVQAPKGWPEKELIVRRDPPRLEYIQQDFFSLRSEHSFDVGIDWGLIEHFPHPHNVRLLAHMQSFLRPGGWQISSCPRDTALVRLFYRLFSDEVNFGYRELLTPPELAKRFSQGGYTVSSMAYLPAHSIVISRSL
jgi:hypothetical protein